MMWVFVKSVAATALSVEVGFGFGGVRRYISIVDEGDPAAGSEDVLSALSAARAELPYAVSPHALADSMKRLGYRHRVGRIIEEATSWSPMTAPPLKAP